MKSRLQVILLILILAGVLTVWWRRDESPREMADRIVRYWDGLLRPGRVAPRPSPPPALPETEPPKAPEKPSAPEPVEPDAPPAPPKKSEGETALEWLLSEPARWPREIATVREIETSLTRDGKAVGSVKLPAGTPLRLAGMDEEELTVGFGESTFPVEPDATDIERRALAIRKKKMEEPALPLPRENIAAAPLPGEKGKPEAVPAIPPAPDKTAVVCVLSWFSPIGSLNGVRSWKGDGYAYEADKRSDGVRNHLLPPLGGMPAGTPEVGSREYYRLMRRAAAATQKQMLEAGFDVMTFDMLPMPDYDPDKPMDERNSPFGHFKTYLEWVKAGEETGMKVAFMPDCANRSADYPGMRVPTGDEWYRILSAALDHIPDSPAVWKLDDAPAIVHFGTDVTYSPKLAPVAEAPPPDGGWRRVLDRLRKDGRKFFFIADVRPSDRIHEWSGIADGVHIFSPAAPESFYTEYQKDAARKFRIPFLWTVSPGYYRGGSAYVEPGFARIHEVYRAAMKAGAKSIYALTWNDLDEDTDIAPSANKGDCLLRVFGFYNAWFKTSEQPRPKEDMVFLSYPLRMPREVASRPPNWGNGKWTSPEFRPKVFYWAYVNSERELEVDGVGKVTLPRGLSFGEVGNVPAEGPGPVPVEARLGGKRKTLPPVLLTGKEDQRKGEGGIEFRYVDLLEGSGK